jgi:hypothetical protein
MTALLSAVIATSLLGGVLLMIAELASLPIAFAAAGSVLFLLGLCLALTIGYIDARRMGHDVLRSLGKGFRELWRWLLEVMP